MNFNIAGLKFQITKQQSVGVERGATGTNIWDGFITEDYNADLQGIKAIEVFDEMRKGDGMVKAILLALSLPIRSAEWSVGGKDVKDEHRDFIDEALFSRMSISFNEWLQHVLLMQPFGFSIFEKVLKFEDNKIWWKKLAPRLPKTLYKWHTDENGGLSGITQWAIKNSTYEYIPIPVENLLVFTNDREGSNFEGVSVLRAAYKHWFIKTMLYNIAGIGLERQAVGLPVITLKDGYTREGASNDLTNAENTVKRIRANEESGLVLPPGFEFDIKEGKINSEALLQHIRHHDTEMAKSALAGFLQLGQEKSGGAYALSKDQSDFFLMSLIATCEYITNVFNRHAIEPLMDLNFPKVKVYPKLLCSMTKIDIGQLVKGTKELTDGNVIIPDDKIEDRMRELLGLPEADRKTSRQKAVPPIKARLKFKEVKFNRKLTRWEQGVKFQQINDRFDKAEEAFVKELGAVAGLQSKDLIKQVERVVESGKINDLFKVTVRHRGDYAETLRGLMGELAEFGKDVASSEVKVKIAKISTQLDKWLKVKADTVVELHAAKMKSTAMLTALNSINSEESTAATLFNVKSALGDYIDREMDMSSQIIVSESINQGRNEVVKTGDMQAAQFSAILDERTCPLCEDLDGQIIDIDSPDFKKFTPPVHGRCRCIWVYIRKEETNVEPDFIRPDEGLIEKNGHLIAHE